MMKEFYEALLLWTKCFLIWKLIYKGVVSMIRPHPNTPQEGLNYLRAYIEENHSVPTISKLRANAKYPHDTYYQRIFGGLISALKQIGVYKAGYIGKTMKELESDKKAQIAKGIQIMCLQSGQIPTYNEYMAEAKKNNWPIGVRGYFPKWNDAVRSAGFDPTKLEFSREELIEIMQKKAIEIGRTPTIAYWYRYVRFPMVYDYIEKFGSWNRALETAGLPVNQRDDWTEEECKEAIKAFGAERERLPCYEEFDGNNYSPCASIIAKKFGSGRWKNAIEYLANEKYIEFGTRSHPYLSNHDHLRPSVKEGLVDDIVGNLNLKHFHDSLYRNFVPTASRMSFDFVIEGRFFIEVAGMINERQYFDQAVMNDDERKYRDILKKKIELSEKYNINLIVLFKNYSKSKIIKCLQPLYDYAKSPIKESNGEIIFNANRINYKKEDKYPDELLLENIYSIYNKIGHMPSLAEMLQPGLPYPSIYTKKKPWNAWVVEVMRKYNIEMSDNDIRNRKLKKYL